MTHGTAVYLACGVRAQLDELHLANNESSGLQLWGPGTWAQAYNLRVFGTGVHPSLDGILGDALPLGTGAVHVRGGARLEVTGFQIYHNAFIGLPSMRELAPKQVNSLVRLGA